MPYKKLPPVTGRMTIPEPKVTVSKTQHPGQTEMERKVLDQIGCGGYNVYDIYKTKDGHKAIQDLLVRGMLEPLPSSGEKDIQFQMPIPVHMHWCQWGADNYVDKDDEL